jgi:hypothetical protein
MIPAHANAAGVEQRFGDAAQGAIVSFKISAVGPEGHTVMSRNTASEALGKAIELVAAGFGNVRGEHRREMARYMVAMLELLLEAQGGDFGQVDRSMCFVVDVRLGERINAGSDHTARLRSIRAACDQIGRMWDTIEPLPRVLRK